MGLMARFHALPRALSLMGSGRCRSRCVPCPASSRRASALRLICNMIIQVRFWLRSMYIALIFQSRGIDASGAQLSCEEARGDEPTRRRLVLTTHLDKMARQHVKQCAPLGVGFMRESLPWISTHAEVLQNCRFIYPEYECSRGPTVDILLADQFAAPDPLSGNYPFLFCMPRKVAKSVLNLEQYVSGLSLNELRKRSFSGTHAARKIEAECGELLGWSTREIDVFGDWTPKAAEGTSAPSRKKAKRTQDSYKPNSNSRQQVRL